MSLFWRIFSLNAVVLGVATGVLLLAPVTVSARVVLTEAVVLVTGLAIMLVANAALLRIGLAPLDRVARRMTTVDLLRPGHRLQVTGHGGVAALIRTFNEMLDRLEQERATSAARALSAQEAERRRVAQELHDEVGQSLTAVLLELKRAVDAAPEPLRQDLRGAQETTRESLEEVRRLAHRLRPGVLEDLGLVSALTSLATDLSAHSGVTVRRHFEPRPSATSQETELVLFRVAQEGLTNIARHADATEVDLRLAGGPEGTTLRIRDNGRGTGDSPEGAGIRGMRERALLVGGDLAVGPAPSGGTEVTLCVPAIREEG
ncbi:HAMP domain-containing sensor histidine kinase [Streptomyces oceani]|uniref:HAMP domain-containing sensor histidine kinase n=1 Tax=Streptomyces oceani TaxID=1075402 RepID=UPI0009A0F87D|nr:HAMP domain-containing sensor histidine kinase [Streptomyces oceani]